MFFQWGLCGWPECISDAKSYCVSLSLTAAPLKTILCFSLKLEFCRQLIHSVTIQYGPHLQWKTSTAPAGPTCTNLYGSPPLGLSQRRRSVFITPCVWMRDRDEIRLFLSSYTCLQPTHPPLQPTGRLWRFGNLSLSPRFENEADKAAVRPLDVAHRLHAEIIGRRRVCHCIGCRTATRQALENMFLCRLDSVLVQRLSGRKITMLPEETWHEPSVHPANQLNCLAMVPGFLMVQETMCLVWPGLIFVPTLFCLDAECLSVMCVSVATQLC